MVGSELRASWQVSKREILLVLGAMLLLNALAAVVGLVVRGDATDLFYDFAGRKIDGIMTLFSGFLLSSAGFGLLLLALLERRGGGPSQQARTWGSCGLLVLYIALDEIIQLHEAYATWMSNAGVPKLAGIDHDVYVWFLYFLLAVAAFRPFVALVRRLVVPFSSFVVAGFLMVMSEVVDFIPWNGLSRSGQNILGPLEEGSKIAGAAVFLLCVIQIFGQRLQLKVPQEARSGEPSAMAPL